MSVTLRVGSVSGRTIETFLFAAILILHANALHCHRKHDHSSDVLLRSDISNVGHDLRHSHNSDDISKSDVSTELYSAEKLVQLRDGDDNSTNDNSKFDHTGGKVVAFCPPRCSCNFTQTNQLQVVCSGHFFRDFPLGKLRKDVEILIIEPALRCSDSPKNESCTRTENQISLGPIYQHLRLLKELRIRFSQVPNIGHRTMWGLSGLRVLDLSHNHLTNVVEQNFEGLYSLKVLCLANNQIKSMVSAAFRHVPLLEVLSLENNKIEELAPRIFYKLQNLKELDLSGNRIQHIDGAIFVDIPNVEIFSCNYCSLHQLQLPEHVYLTKMSTLQLSGNKISTLDDVHRHFLNQVQHLHLSRNQISEISVHHFYKNRLLKTLTLDRNNVSIVDTCALCNTSIQTLDLAYNKMQHINEKMLAEDVRSLNNLRLSGNRLPTEEVASLLQRLPALETVSLDSTGIVSVPMNMFASNPMLKSVNMSQNFMITLEIQVFNHLEWLEVLDLSSNYLVGPSEEFFDVVRQKARLRMVYLQNNHFVCDKCHILPLMDWLHSGLQYWGACQDRRNPLCLKCRTPNEFMHMPIENLHLDELPDCQTVDTDIGRGAFLDESSLNNLAYWPPPPGNLNTNSPYVAGAIGCVLILIAIVFVVVRYRHYGVYFTNEEDQLVDEEDLLRNPVVVLDRNSESYINLRYPVLAPPPPVKPPAAKESEVCATSFKIKFEDSV